MKKLLLLFMIGGIISTGCQKEISWPGQETNSENDMEVATGGLRAVEAKAVVSTHVEFGWVLELENNEIVVPKNLPEEFKIEDSKVKIAYFHTTEKVPCECSIQKNYIDIIQIDWRI
jgi:hypothetical protein